MPKVSEEYFIQKRNEIIDSAYKIALEKPIISMTLMDVREEAGMARGAIYRYYDSLDQILADLIIRVNKNNS
ncbi:MAG: helix-turn-helix transcriptional regulator, partial [Lachnospiraceae bacterium]|nr:helix-turn-helix transcriptional regulator [Lachnospiraceae bacterium]